MRISTSRFHRFCVLFVLCSSIIVSRGSEADSGGYVSSLKQFLNTNYSDYEVVFSVIQHNNEDLERKLDAFNKSSKRHISVQFERPMFFRVRRGQDGFLVHVADSLNQINDYNVSASGNYAEGVISNSFWSVHNEVLTIDDGFSAKLKNQQDRTWEDLADEFTRDIFSLGLWISKGSDNWDGTNFTAKTSTYAPVPSDKRGQRIISGRLILSNGVPSEITYEFASNRFAIFLSYEDPIQETFKIPSRFDVSAQFNGGASSSVTYQILSLQLTNFPPDSTAPNIFADTNFNPGLSIVHIYANGVAKMSQANGKSIRPVEVKFAGVKLEAWGKWAAFAIFFFTSLIFFRLVYERRKQK